MAAKVSFNNNQRVFYPSLKKAVEEYFTSNGLKKSGNWKLYSKALVLFPLAFGIYFFVLFGTYSAFTGIALSVLMGLTLVSIAFNIMHDACHGSYSSKKWVNDLMSHSMNALGSNSFIWKVKHNVVHHTYTNVDGIDDDIAKSPVLRLCPTQVWKPAHRFQHIYMFLVYGLSTILWLFLTDYIKYFNKKVVITEMKMSTWDHVVFWSGKLLYWFFYAVIPIYFIGWQPWLAGFLIVHLVMGITLAVVFQLAHVVEKTEFESADEAPKMLDREWAAHELRTTANFAPDNKWISWFVGGLNYQVEHHLFPRISHVHYPALSRIVREQCEKFGLPYHYYPTMLEAIASHVRVMKALGKKEARLEAGKIAA
ncbi:MAG: Linoleoyl-CoA desaturase [Flaviaesturariibacter sp.]|nr:Linoleoyl-CoA desaturase [Flaviaesturariibacter sp.]